ncbi:proline-rich protein 29 [Microcaecilia unicolor]|uniref:Proline-rich protein 29-like n=1 Tax=Microcaecilia unicolor TaxID=1415580 RepID=A0A6P7WTD9_9AMPH|nr:proline-rich protein 29-like [Microcaecilia unicolor]
MTSSGSGEEIFYPNQLWSQQPARVQIIQQPIPQQPTTIFQQIPAAMTPLTQPVRPGHAKEDLIELMMIQNAQMHQLIMNNMTISALSSFGYAPGPPAPQANIVPVHIEEDQPNVIYHHHYNPYPSTYSTFPSWQPQPQMMLPHKEPVVRHLSLDQPMPSTRHRGDQRAVPPPPPPSATGTVGADIPPASEYYDMTEGEL